MHHDKSVDGDAKKPEIILHYNSTKSGVDNLDHLATMYTARRKVNRWPMVLFLNMIDVGAIAAFILWLSLNPTWKESEGKRRRGIFLRDLGYALVMPHMERRSSIPTLQLSVRYLCVQTNYQHFVFSKSDILLYLLLYLLLNVLDY